MTRVVEIMVIGYTIGNFSTSYILGKILRNMDIRSKGSGNAGATNALRVFGAKIAGMTFLLDALKGVIAVLIGTKLLGDTGGLIGGVAAVIGHNWPVVLKFKGGKGIATTIGVVATVEPITAIVTILIGLSIIIKSKYVSLGSISAMGLLPVIGALIVRPFDRNFFAFTLILAIMAIYRHKSNINRLLKGRESKIGEKA